MQIHCSPVKDVSRSYVGEVKKDVASLNTVVPGIVPCLCMTDIAIRLCWLIFSVESFPGENK